MTDLHNPTLAAPASQRLRLSESIQEGARRPIDVGAPLVVGVLPGEGIGPEVIAAALDVLASLEAHLGLRFEVRTGTAIGTEAEVLTGRALSEDVVAFCTEVFRDGGAVLAGPGGGRFVYDLRRCFDLFCKLNPVVVSEELCDVGRVKPRFTRDVDLLVIRENISGLYHGEAVEGSPSETGRRVDFRFGYSAAEVARIVRVAARIAAARRGRMDVVVKESGLPGLSALWKECAEAAAREAGVEAACVDIDFEAYRMVHEAQALDVIVAPNLFADVLSDVGGLLLGSRGLTYGASYSSDGAAVYQTNHGAAWDLAGSDRANPVGQILSLAMMLHESHGLWEAADIVEEAVREVWRKGWRTADMAAPGCRTVGTRELGQRVADAVAARAQQSV